MRPLPTETIPSRKLPLKERWSARYFNFAEIFEEINTTKAHVIGAAWHYDLSGWEIYCQFLGSEHSIETPYKDLTGPHRHGRVCIEEDKNES
mgnify:CR=1 FL=1